jgi:hypothetical protein
MQSLKWSTVALLAIAPLVYVTPAAAVEGYVTTRHDHQPVRSRHGGCVHDREWHVGMRFADCEPAPVQPVAASAAQPAPEQEPLPPRPTAPAHGARS